MMKENGRTKRGHKAEKAYLKGKVFVCPVCGKEFSIPHAEFGSKYYCDTCKNTQLLEK